VTRVRIPDLPPLPQQIDSRDEKYGLERQPLSKKSSAVESKAKDEENWKGKKSNSVMQKERAKLQGNAQGEGIGKET